MEWQFFPTNKKGFFKGGRLNYKRLPFLGRNCVNLLKFFPFFTDINISRLLGKKSRGCGGIKAMRIEKSGIFDVTQNDGIEIRGKVEGTAAGTDVASDFFVKDKKTTQVTYGNPAEEGKGTIADVMAQAGALDATLIKNEMLFAGNSATTKDCVGIGKDGFSLGGTDVETIVTETDKMKMQLAKAGVDVSCMGDGLSEEVLTEMTGNPALAAQIANSLTQADLPVTEENLTESMEAVSQTEGINGLSDGAMKYMLDNELPPTIENIYKAEYSGSASYSAPAKAADDYEAMQDQIENVIKKAGLPVNEETLGNAYFMLRNDIALTPENLTYLGELKEMDAPLDQEKVLNAITDAVAEGKRPKDAMLISGYSLADQAKDALAVVDSATDQDVKTVVGAGLELNIQNLAWAEMQNADETVIPVDLSDTDIAFVTAKRKLEETRLAMTAEANYSLLKQGISIDTVPLAELVEELKNVENTYYKNLLEQGGAAATAENVKLFADTTDVVTSLKTMPAYTLGIKSADLSTLQGLHDAGSALEQNLKRANESYETLMTEPRRDLGDSITKAFQNVDDILEDLNLETSESNERAVRILAYNRLDINETSIAQMKEADAQVQRAFANLSPAVVREMIKKGINPLDMDITELNRTAEEIKNSLDDDGSEHFSEYLWKLENNNEISDEERDAYIGIYRLLNQVEKTDGAVIGALIEQGTEVTMRNLLTGVRSLKHQNMDVTVDDNFGAISELTGNNNSITAQIEKAYQTDCAKMAKELISPEAVRLAVKESGWEDLTPEQLLEQLRNAKAEVQDEEERYVRGQQADIAACMKASDEVYQMLADYDVPNTVYNVLAAQEYMENRNGAFRKLFASETEREADTDIEAAKAEMLEKYGEAVKTPEEMKAAEEELEKRAASVMDTMLVDHANVTSMQVKEMKLMRTQIELGGMLAKNETYAIPVLIQNEITSVHLRVIRDDAKKGLVNITFETDHLGKVAAELKASGNIVSGYIASDRKETTEFLSEHADALQEAIETGLSENTEGTAAAEISFVTSESLDLTHFEQKEAVKQEGEKELSKVQTTTLYTIARKFLETAKSL